MGGAELALLLLILACIGLRGAGLLVAGRLRPDHPLIRWAASVALATLAAFIALAILAPGGGLASIPAAARIAGLCAAIAMLTWRGGLLQPLLAGLALTLLVAAWTGGARP
ncbi:AzlD domain-containing protein [Sediminicoccus sp. KRV36]|uniref:AzlD domain-containing protein n=1 Tax=Sediminicoccus sp. KRV36 TaxID=3133721 RepID=UPI00200D567D|nr:AzlD domain-containing protein [Sediminicoccus rosea]UPY37789.1 AzlD domain-containing protein [Sediminicoccus rosea]